MERFNKICLQYLKYFWPTIVIAVILDLLGYNGDGPNRKFLEYVMDFLGVPGVLWLVVLFYFFFAVVLNEKIRNSFVRKLARIEEHDEREVYITGLVSKKTFISMVAMLVLLLFLSALTIDVYKTPQLVKEGKNGIISIGFGMSLLRDGESEDATRVYIVKYNGLPLTAAALLF